MNPLIRRLYVEVYNEEQKTIEAQNTGKGNPSEENIDMLLGKLI